MKLKIFFKNAITLQRVGFESRGLYKPFVKDFVGINLVDDHESYLTEEGPMLLRLVQQQQKWMSLFLNKVESLYEIVDAEART